MAVKAKESPQILKARKKLKRQIAEENKHITVHALSEMTKVIHHWLERHKEERISLKDKSITLFDENQHSAQTQSKFIQQMLKNLQGPKQKVKSAKTLEGRITQ